MRAIPNDALVVVCSVPRIVGQHRVAPERVVLIEWLELVQFVEIDSVAMVSNFDRYATARAFKEHLIQVEVDPAVQRTRRTVSQEIEAKRRERREPT